MRKRLELMKNIILLISEKLTEKVINLLFFIWYDGNK